MNKPLLVCSTYTAQPEHPSDWKVEQVVGENVSLTLDGTSVADRFYRKHKYILQWDAMSKEDYDDLSDLINYHLDNNTDITFTYEKWGALASSGVDCIGKLSARGFRAGSGSSYYYSSVTLELTEISKRA